jgi:uncharacterized membrane protein YkgB
MTTDVMGRREAAIVADGAAVLESAGLALVRWGLVVVLAWIGAMKFTAYEAAGIEPLVANSPLMAWTLPLLGLRGVSNLLGAVEISVALLIALRSVAPALAAVGSAAAVAMFCTTLTFLLSTPGWEASLGGFPALSVAPGQFVLKDLVLLGASLWSLGESLRAVRG